MFKKYHFLLLITLAMGIAQNETIIPAQINAIITLAETQGFTGTTLDAYLVRNYGVTIHGLKKEQAIQIINRFQSTNPPKPSSNDTGTAEILIPEPILAEILEVGMSKRFYLVDGNVIDGTITAIEEGLCKIGTKDGDLAVPVNEILEETVDLLKKDEVRYKGPVIHETFEELVIRSKYGDVVVQKRDIHDLDRYQGGRLVPKTEVRKKFYQGEAQLISVFLDPTAFPLEPNTFYLSGLSMGYGFTERFMITTKFASNFSGDLNLEPHFRVYHKKTADTEAAFALGLGLYRAYPVQTIASKYAHFISVGGDSLLNETGFFMDENNEPLDFGDILLEPDQKSVFAEFFGVYSTRRKNPTGRGKVGWTAGLKVSNAFMNLPKFNDTTYSWVNNRSAIPFRLWASFEYDLQKNLKFVGSAWADNGNRSRAMGEVIDDFFGNDDTQPFIFDSPKGKYNMFDFDFGFLYAFNENLRLGIHFQQPYIDIYWKFLEL